MRTISLLNMKGGVGKTTLAVNLAWHLALRRDKRVLLVDLDPQFNATQYLMEYQAWDTHRKARGTIADLLLDAEKARMTIADATSAKPEKSFQRLHQVSRTASNSYLYLLPAELALARAVKNPQGVEFRLQKLLDGWGQYFDFAFVDCAPTDTVLTAVALMASDFLLVPIRPDRFSILGYGLMKEIIRDFKVDYPDPHKVRDLGVVFTRTGSGPDDIESQCQTDVAKAASYIFSTQIRESRSYLRSVHKQTPVFDTRYARQITRDSIDELVDEMLRRMDAVETPRVPKAGRKP